MTVPTQPDDLGDGWAVAAPADVGMPADAFDNLPRQFTAWTEANLHAALIVYRGRLVCEHYFAGEDQRWGTPLGRVAYNAGLRHDLRSISKSITALLFGIAVDRGLIASLDMPVFAWFPEHADLATGEKAKINLRHLLTMSAGLAWNEDLPYSNPANSERQMSDAPDRCRYVLEQPSIRPAGATWVYNGGLTALLAAILESAVKQPLDTFAQEALFRPLGIEDVEWVRNADGTANAVSGLRMRPRDLARIGRLVLDGGQWNGRRVVSKAWIDDSTSPHVNGLGLFFYGYQWWLGRSLVDRREIRWIAGQGYGGQRLYIVPDLDLVVVVMAGLYAEPILQSFIGDIVLRRYALPAALSAHRK